MSIDPHTARYDHSALGPLSIDFARFISDSCQDPTGGSHTLLLFDGPRLLGVAPGLVLE